MLYYQITNYLLKTAIDIFWKEWSQFQQYRYGYPEKLEIQTKTGQFILVRFCWLRGRDSNPGSRGYGPREMPLLHPASFLTLILAKTAFLWATVQYINLYSGYLSSIKP